MPCAVILTALPVEYLAVRAHLSDLHEEMHPQGTIYERGIFAANGQTWEVGIAEVGAGNAGAAVEAERAIAHFKPDVLLFVGIAGGIKDIAIGDVVAATDVYGYEAGKVGGGEKFYARPKVGKAAHKIIQRARVEAKKGEWLQRLSNGLKSQPRVFVAPIAAGEKVLASRESDLFRFLRDSCNDAIAVEMEGFGFLSAAFAYPNIQSIVIRGISDLIEDKNAVDPTEGTEEDRQARASQNASAFTFEVLAKLDIDSISRSSPDPISPSDISEYESEDLYTQWIEGKIEKFAGRQFVFNAIADFLKNYQNGYFLVMAEPGAGKSTLLAQYVSNINRNCIAFFNPKVIPYTTKEFLESFRREVIKRYKVNPKDKAIEIPNNPRMYEEFLYRLLQKTVKQSGRPVFLAIDALDEVDSLTHVQGANILCLPRLLPKGVYCIMTARSQDSKEHHYFRSTESPLISFDLQEERYKKQNIADTEVYIWEKRVKPSQSLSQQIFQLGKTEEEFVREFARFGNGNFMYIFYVLNDLEIGKYQGRKLRFDDLLKELPKNLEQYYKKHWEEMLKDNTIPPEVKLKVAAYLASMDDAVTINFLAQSLLYIKETDIYMLRIVLKEWGQFLYRLNDRGFTKYMIYHTSFRDFLFFHPDLEPYRQKILGGEYPNIYPDKTVGFAENLSGQIFDNLTEGLFDEDD